MTIVTTACVVIYNMCGASVFLFWCVGTRVGPGGHDQKLAVKDRKQAGFAEPHSSSKFD